MSLLTKVDLETLDYASGGQPFVSVNAGATIGADGSLDYALGGQPFVVTSLLATVTGSAADTNENDTSSASGTTTLSGSSAITNANDTSAASGKTTIVGSSATTNANDTSSASGKTTIVGTSATTNNNDTSQAEGTVSDAVSGSASVTEGADTSSASGVVVAPADTSQNSGGWPEHIPQRRVRKLVQELEQAEEEQPARRFTIDQRPEVPVVLDKGAQAAVDRFLQAIQEVARQPISLDDTEEDDVAQLLQDDYQIRQMIGSSLASELSNVLDELMGKKPLHDR